ncbi:hypothetical protein DPMN_131034 [Dreissena polymorpha]|uniref:Uncharacterized protein n=1 Tax=Dreissena polymorpha TaxID=45954 RepID=A0A9D4H8S2_DREPO|nr:hypothetical protein DPMN_131034 [Dreissena polymorpha]
MLTCCLSMGSPEVPLCRLMDIYSVLGSFLGRPSTYSRKPSTALNEAEMVYDRYKFLLPLSVRHITVFVI